MSAPGQPVAQAPPVASPEALAVAQFLRSQDLKSRTCILQGQRKDLFKVKRAIRALRSESYAKARKKNSLLPKVNDQTEAFQAFSLLPRNLLALRVSKIEPESHEGHSHGKPTKRVKGLWTVKIEQQQEMKEDLYYTWFYEPRTWKPIIMGIGVILILLLVIMFPLWPPMLRLGVWYLSMGMLGLIGLFFAMSIFRLILFVITMFVASPGIWLYPNLFEDVGFFDSFRPLWAWHKVGKEKKKKSAVPSGGKQSSGAVVTSASASQSSGTVVPPKPTVEDG